MSPVDDWGAGAKQPPFIHCWMSGGPGEGQTRGTRPAETHVVVRRGEKTGLYERVGDILLWMGWYED